MAAGAATPAVTGAMAANSAASMAASPAAVGASMNVPGGASAAVAPGAASIAPASSVTPTPDAGMWGQIKGFLGDTAGKFVQMMGDTPEERQTNLEAFTKTIGAVNQLGAELGQTTLPKRLGEQKGAEMLEAAQARPMPPLPDPSRLSPEMLDSILGNTMGAQKGIKEATSWPRR